MKTLAILGLAAAYFVFKAWHGELQNGEPQNRLHRPLGRIETPEQIRWLADVRAVDALTAQGWLPIDQHEVLIGGPMGPDWLN